MKKLSDYTTYSSNQILEIVAIFLVCSFIGFCQYSGVTILSVATLWLANIALFLCIIRRINGLKWKSRFPMFALIALIAVGATIGSVILIQHYTSSWNQIGSQIMKIPLLSGFSLMLVEIVVCFGLFILGTIQNELSNPGRKRMATRFLVVGIYLLLVILTNLDWYDTWPMYDSYAYIYESNSIHLSSIFLPDGFLFAGHLADTWSISYIILRILPFNDINTSYFLNLILMFADMVLFDSILRHLIKNQKNYFYVLSTLAFGVSPLLLGSVYTVYPDKMMLFGTLLFLYGYFKENRKIQLLGAYIACTSKEVGLAIIAIVSTVEVIHWLYCLVKNKNNQRKTIIARSAAYFLCLLGIGMINFLRVITSVWLSEAHTIRFENYPSIDGYKWNSIALSFNQIKCVLKAIFLTNFTWVFLGLLLLAACKLVYDKKRNQNEFTVKIRFSWILLLTCCVSSTLILCLYITAVVWRYYVVSVAILYILGIMGLWYLTSNLKRYREKVRTGILVILGGLMFAQSYFTIDPVMLSSFATLETGNGKVVILEQNAARFFYETISMFAENNQQIRTFTQALDIALSHVLELDENICITFSNEHKVASNINATVSIWGHTYEYFKPSRWANWDYEKNKRYLSESSEGQIPVIYIDQDTDLSQQLESYDAIYYIEMPWADSIVSNRSDLSYYTTVEHMGWTLNIYLISGE